MDYDDDGILDFISGSYDPGDVYLFRGLGDGEYAKAASILDENGRPLVHHPVEFAKYTALKDDSKADSDEATSARVASFGSWPAPVDWDDDGDLDILIGSFGGGLFLRMNVGTRNEPRFDGESITVCVNDSPLTETGHADPVVADWDGDGKWDMVIGSADGSVGWYRNIGTASKPEFGSRNILVKPAAESKFLEQNLKADEKPVPGARAQICVTDYNRDGLLDLIVGDYSLINWTRELTSEEKAQFQELKARETELTAALEEVRSVMFAEDTDESLKTLKEAEYRKIADEYLKVRKERKSFYVESQSASFIWLYLRTNRAAARVAKF